MSVISRNCRKPVDAILEALQEAVAEFAEGAPLADEQTAIINRVYI